MKKSIFIWSIVLIIIAAIVGLNFEIRDKNKYVSVKTKQVVHGNVKCYLSTTGIIKSKNIKEYYISQGQVRKINVKEGDKVNKYSTLMTYEMQGMENYIIADFNGVVTKLNASVGTISTGTQPVIIIQDLNDLECEINADKYSANGIKIGQSAVITYGNRKYNGNVSYIAPVAEIETSAAGQNAVLPVDIDIPSSIEGLIVGFDSDVNILVGEVKNVLKVPAESIKTDKTGKNYVFIVENGEAIRKVISLGLQSDTEAEVKGGLSEGDRVILNPSGTMKNGTLVTGVVGGK